MVISISESSSVPNFLPSRSGLHFPNFYPPKTEYPVINLNLWGKTKINIFSGDAGNGICGGFSYTVMDLFLAGLQPPPYKDLPAQGSTDFNYLVNRFLDSLGSANDYKQAEKLVEWILLPDNDIKIPLYVVKGIGRLMVEEEWPRIKSDIDSGRPSAIMLAAAPKCGLGDISCITSTLRNCHQVLVYGYTLDKDNLTLSIYDCNYPDDDSQMISLDISQLEHTINITAPGIPYTIRGFFRNDYGYKDPARFLAAFPSVLKDSTR